MNTALGGQGFAINCYNDPADGNGGIFHFYPEGGELADDQYPAFPEFGVGSMVRITNMSDDFEGSSMADTGLSSSPGHSSDPWAADAWTVIAETVNADNSHTLRLQNSVSSRSIGAVGDYTARMGARWLWDRRRPTWWCVATATTGTTQCLLAVMAFGPFPPIRCRRRLGARRFKR